MTDARYAALQAFIEQCLGADVQGPEPASSDASFRRYWRVHGAGGSHIIMDAPPDKENCGPFIDVSARLVQAGLRAPAVLAQDLEHGFLLLDDLGTRTLLQDLRPETVDRYYDSGMRSLLKMQTSVDGSGLPSYDELRLTAEMELMPQWYLQAHLGLQLTCGDWDTLEQSFGLLLRSARSQPQVFVHRDYHSRNLMLGVSDDSELGILDFQDAVIGPITYDLVSLLKDCYVRWPTSRVDDWAERYRQMLAEQGVVVPERSTWLRAFDLMGLQRHLKVLGIFARLHHRDGKSGYLADLPRVHDYCLQVCDRYAELAALGERLRRWAPPR